MKKLTLRDLNVKDKKVLMRVDFNVPLNPDKTIADDTRIRQVLPSIQYILNKGGSIILMSHLGRPKGKKNPDLSLAPIAKHLTALLSQSVLMAPDSIGPEVKKMAEKLSPGHILLLENLRFHEAEETPDKDPSFAKQLAELGDLYVNDAFGTAHRAHSSTATITQFFPHKAAAGFLMEKEIQELSKIISNPKHPFYAILGGAKIGSKIGVLDSLASKIDGICIGGGMAFTFFKVQNIEIGNSICDDSLLPKAQAFMELCKKKKINLLLPVDIVIGNAFSNDAETKIISAKEGIPKGWQGMDVGPKTIETWMQTLSKAATLFWNGPMGVFEFPKFATATEALAHKLANLSSTIIVGGGDSVAAINKLHLEEHFTHISTGGGASLEFIEYGHLPGIDALSDK